jgi:HK97 family phage major capsid protein
MSLQLQERRLADELGVATNTYRDLLDTAEKRLGGYAAMSGEERARYDVLGMTSDEATTYKRAADDAARLEGELQQVRAAGAARDAADSRRSSTQGSGTSGTGAPGADVITEFLTGKRSSLEMTIPRDLRVGMHSRAIAASRSAASSAEFRAWLKTSPSWPNQAIPEFMAGYLEALYNDSMLLSSAGFDVMTTANGKTISVRQETSRGGATWMGEAAPIPESDGTWGAPIEIKAHKAGRLTRASFESVEDDDVDLVAWFAKSSAAAIAELGNLSYAVGDGVAKPRGYMLDALPSGIAAGLTTDKLIDLQHVLGTKYRATAKFILNDAEVRDIRKLKNADGDYIWQPGLTLNAPNVLLGKEVLTDEAQPAGQIAYGEFKHYLVRLAGSLRFERSDHASFATDEITWRTIQRMDGKLMRPDAVRTWTR